MPVSEAVKRELISAGVQLAGEVIRAVLDRDADRLKRAAADMAAARAERELLQKAIDES